MALKLLPPGTASRAYVVGRANARLTKGAIVGVIAFVAVFALVAVLSGAAVVPGFLFLYFLWRSIWPLRGIVVADQGLALVERNFLQARPKTILAMVSPAQTRVARDGKRGQIAIAGDVVSLQGDEFDMLLGAFNMGNLTGLPS